jgi:hypothetical protein
VFVIASVFSAHLEILPSSERGRLTDLEKTFLPLLQTSPSKTVHFHLEPDDHVSLFLPHASSP